MPPDQWSFSRLGNPSCFRLCIRRLKNSSLRLVSQHIAMVGYHLTPLHHPHWHVEVSFMWSYIPSSEARDISGSASRELFVYLWSRVWWWRTSIHVRRQRLLGYVMWLSSHRLATCFVCRAYCAHVGSESIYLRTLALMPHAMFFRFLWCMSYRRKHLKWLF